VIRGGLGDAVLEFVADNGYNVDVHRIGIPDVFIEHGKVSELYKIAGMDAESISDVIIGKA
jgi:1-deoxy-D-xylulose-5-phosphate synthase